MQSLHARERAKTEERLNVARLNSEAATEKAKATAEKAEQLARDLSLATQYGGVGLARVDMIAKTLQANSVLRELLEFPEADYPVISCDDWSSRLAPNSKVLWLSTMDERTSLLNSISHLPLDEQGALVTGKTDSLWDYDLPSGKHVLCAAPQYYGLPMTVAASQRARSSMCRR